VQKNDDATSGRVVGCSCIPPADANVNRCVCGRAMPRRQIVRLPNDHTHGASANKPSPHAHMAVKTARQPCHSTALARNGTTAEQLTAFRGGRWGVWPMSTGPTSSLRLRLQFPQRSFLRPRTNRCLPRRSCLTPERKFQSCHQAVPWLCRSVAVQCCDKAVAVAVAVAGAGAVRDRRLQGATSWNASAVTRSTVQRCAHSLSNRITALPDAS